MKITIEIKADSITIGIGNTKGTHRRREEGGWIMSAADNDRLSCALAKAADMSDHDAEDILDDLFMPLMEVADSLENA